MPRPHGLGVRERPGNEATQLGIIICFFKKLKSGVIGKAG